MQIKFKKSNKKLQLKNKNSFSSNFDPNGSYTGVNQENPLEKPVQDADDL